MSVGGPARLMYSRWCGSASICVISVGWCELSDLGRRVLPDYYLAVRFSTTAVEDDRNSESASLNMSKRG